MKLKWIFTLEDDGRTEGYGFFNFLFLWADMCENLDGAQGFKARG